MRRSKTKLNEVIPLIQSSSHLPSPTLKPKSPHTLPSLPPVLPPALSLSAGFSIHAHFYCSSWNRKGMSPSEHSYLLFHHLEVSFPNSRMIASLPFIVSPREGLSLTTCSFILRPSVVLPTPSFCLLFFPSHQ